MAIDPIVSELATLSARINESAARIECMMENKTICPSCRDHAEYMLQSGRMLNAFVLRFQAHMFECSVANEGRTPTDYAIDSAQAPLLTRGGVSER